jgi:transcriptional regulator with GAF, ATPase, and Fis domain
VAKARSSDSSKRSSTDQQAELTGPSQSTTATRGRKPQALSIRWMHPSLEPVWSLLEGTELTLGREDDNRIVLGGSSISRRHALIQRRGAAFAIRDLQSLNGVHCDGVRVDLALLRRGNVVRLGDWVGVVAPAATEEAAAFRELAPGLLGSETLQKVVATAERAASSRLSILILGETGTGKELLARAIHRFSQRSGPFVAVNCAALPESLVEAELFGHEIGAFTGAVRPREGLLRRAHGGTLFLDEVGELPLAAQAKLLRVLQENVLTPVGGNRELSVDLRVVCATHCALKNMIDTGRFRSDLYARIEGLVLELPPLRDRREDIVPLLEHFVALHLRAGAARPQLSARFVERLNSLPFVRNVRELSKLAERMAVLHGEAAEWGGHALAEASSSTLGESEPVRASEPSSASASNRTIGPSARPDREALLRALEHARGNVAHAARTLGRSKQTLYTWIREYRIDLKAIRPHPKS